MSTTVDFSTPRPTTPVAVEPRDNKKYYSLAKSVSVGATIGFLSATPVTYFFLTVPSVGGLVSGAIAGALFSQSSYSNFHELPLSTQIITVIGAYALHVLSTYLVCLAVGIPMTFTAAALFVPLALPVVFFVSAFGLAILNFEKAGELAYETYKEEPPKELVNPPQHLLQAPRKSRRLHIHTAEKTGLNKPDFNVESDLSQPDFD